MSCRAKSRHLLFLDKSRVENTISCRPLDCARGDKNAYSDCARGDKNGASDYVLAGIVALSVFICVGKLKVGHSELDSESRPLRQKKTPKLVRGDSGEVVLTDSTTEFFGVLELLINADVID